jgi:hypothetical protein
MNGFDLGNQNGFGPKTSIRPGTLRERKSRRADDDLPLLKLKTSKVSINGYVDFGGPITITLFIIIAIIALFGINMVCNEQPCSFTKMPNLGKYAKLESWFTLRAFVMVLTMLASILALTVVPFFGNYMTLPGGKRFVFNGVFSFVGVLLAVVIIGILYMPVFPIIYEDYFQLEIACFIFGLSLGIIVSIKSIWAEKDQLNPNGNTGNIVYDICVGRELNPVLFGSFPVKVLLFRFAVIGVV